MLTTVKISEHIDEITRYTAVVVTTLDRDTWTYIVYGGVYNIIIMGNDDGSINRSGDGGARGQYHRYFAGDVQPLYYCIENYSDSSIIIREFKK